MLEHLFGSKTRLKLLQIFFREPDKASYMRELARLADTQLNAVRRELLKLERLGLVSEVEVDLSEIREIGTERSKYYKLQKDSLLYAELKNLLIKSKELEEQEFVENLKKRSGDIRFMLLTGFFMGDTEVDTDVLLVGDVKPLAIARLMKDFEKTSGQSLRYTIMTDKEFHERREIGDKFLYSIFEGKHQVPVDEYHITRL